MAEENIKNVKLKIGTEAQFQEKLKDLPLNTFVGVTDPIDESDLSAEVVAKLTAGGNALPKPTNTTTGTTGQFLQKTDDGSVWATVGPYSTATNLLNGGANGALVINGAGSSSTGTYSVMLGYANKTAKVNALANGHNNVINASNGFTTGYNNTISGNASAAIVAGYNNTVQSPNTITAGHNCVNETANGIVAGLYCETHCPGSLVVGRYLRASSGSQAQVIFGNYNIDRGNDGSATAPVFVIGNGTSDKARNNLVEIRNNGEMRLNGTKVALISDVPSVPSLYYHILEGTYSEDENTKLYLYFYSNHGIAYSSFEEFLSTFSYGSLQEKYFLPGILERGGNAVGIAYIDKTNDILKLAVDGTEDLQFGAFSLTSDNYFEIS